MASGENIENDETDKWPFPFRWKSKRKHQQKSEQKPGQKSDSVSTDIIPSIDGDVDGDDYSLKFPLSKCLIFSHKEFFNNKERKGTEKDAGRLYNQFRKLGFAEVTICEDYTVRKVMKKLTEVAEEDKTKNSCLVCCILTHGDMGILCAKDGVYPVNKLYEIFNGEASPNLRGKPKIFFIQACQGSKIDSGVPVIYKSVESKVPESMDSVVKIPVHADFLIMFSSFPGYLSYKNEVIGSYFIQDLCDVLEEHAQNKHLMDMLTIVTRRVALYFESSNHKEELKDKKKQVPYITTTLTKNVKFIPKILS